MYKNVSEQLIIEYTSMDLCFLRKDNELQHEE